MALPGMGALLGGPNISPHTRGKKIDKLKIDPELEKRSLTGAFDKDSRGGSTCGDPLCPEAPQGATEQNRHSPGTGETPASWDVRLLSGMDHPVES